MRYIRQLKNNAGGNNARVISANGKNEKLAEIHHHTIVCLPMKKWNFKFVPSRFDKQLIIIISEIYKHSF